MDVGNRLGIIIATLVVIFFALLVAMMAWGAPHESVNKLNDFVGFLRDHQDEDLAKLVTSLGAAVVILLGALVIILELSPPVTPGVRIGPVRSGDATITPDVIAGRIEQEVLAVDHISAARVRVGGRGKRVDVEMDLDVDADAPLAQTSEQACSRTRDLLERQMSIPLVAPPRANLHYRELRITREDAAGAPAEAEPASRATDPEAEGVHAGWQRPPAVEEERPPGDAEDPQGQT